MDLKLRTKIENVTGATGMFGWTYAIFLHFFLIGVQLGLTWVRTHYEKYSNHVKKCTQARFLKDNIIWVMATFSSRVMF